MIYQLCNERLQMRSSPSGDFQEKANPDADGLKDRQIK